jgi:hypothetical protein
LPKVVEDLGSLGLPAPASLVVLIFGPGRFALDSLVARL